MAPLALRVHLNHFNAIIIMRLSNIIFKGFCEEGKELHFLCLTILSRGGEQVNGRGGDDDEEEEEGDGESPVTPTHPRPRPSVLRRHYTPPGLTAQCAHAGRFTPTEAARGGESNKGKKIKSKSPRGLCHTAVT